MPRFSSQRHSVTSGQTSRRGRSSTGRSVRLSADHPHAAGPVIGSEWPVLPRVTAHLKRLDRRREALRMGSNA
jgi:hypothetical protein